MPGLTATQKFGYLDPAATPRSRPAGGGMPDLSLSTPSFTSVMPPAGAVPGSGQQKNQQFNQGKSEGRPGRTMPDTGEGAGEAAEGAGEAAAGAGEAAGLAGAIEGAAALAL